MLKTGWLRAGLTLTALSAVAAFSFGLGAGSAEAAVVYCKTVGVPRGCVVRPTAAGGVTPAPAGGVAPVARRAGAGGKLQLGAAPRGAAAHVVQAARRLAGRLGAGRYVKAIAVVR